MPLPNFLIVGAPKSGTTSLMFYLIDHPEVFMPRDEIAYFNTYIKKGIKWYKKFFEQWNGEKAIGEKTPNYMYNESVARAVKKLNPNMKIIFLFRNPIDRSLSQYWHNYRRGRIDLDIDTTINTILNKETDYKYMTQIIEWSRYTKYFTIWKKYFPVENILCLQTEKLKDETEITFFQTCKFLGISEITPPNIGKQFNVGVQPRSKMLAKIIQKYDFLRHTKNPIRYELGILEALNTKGKFVHLVFKHSPRYHEIRQNVKTNYGNMKAKTRQMLEEELKQDIKFWKNIKS